MKTLAANLRRAVRDCEVVSIGGGLFQGVELEAAADLLDPPQPTRGEMSTVDRAAIADLRRRGFAVVVMHPHELGCLRSPEAEQIMVDAFNGSVS